MSDAIDAFISHMRSVGCEPDTAAGITADDQWHRYAIKGDKKGSKNGSYKLRIENDGFACGLCINYKEGVSHGWHSKSQRAADPEARAEWKRRSEEAKAAQERQVAEDAAKAANKAATMWKRATTEGTSPYLVSKGFTLDDVKCRIGMHGLLVVPMWADGALVGVQSIAADGSKRFLSGQRKAGAYHAMKGDGDVIVVGEGLATCAALRRALGCSVVVAFDAGNLKPVALAMREKYPDKRIVIAADNDQWTFINTKRPKDLGDAPAGDDPRWMDWREAGKLTNPGVEKAQQAAVAIGGAVVLAPEIASDDPAKRTDWWDFAAEHGDEAVRGAFAKAMEPPVVQDPEVGPDDYADAWEPDHEPADAGDYGHFNNKLLEMVRPLGHNEGQFYFFPRAAGQIKHFSASSLGNIQNLCSMADKSLWENYFGGGEGGTKKIVEAASTALIAECLRIGIYDSDKARGVGAWMDGDVPVFNAGNMLMAGDWKGPPQDYRSEHVYQAGAKIMLPDAEPLTNAEASELLKICRSLNWRHTQQGYVLAGWIVAAAIGGALKWRPHVVITGEKGAGKSWVVENVVKAALGDIYVDMDGGSTEPGIRREIGGGSRPITMDEAESESQRDRANMELVYSLARKSSSGAQIGNATGKWRVRSCFLFGAINPRITQGADLDRNSMVELLKNRGEDAREKWVELQRIVGNNLTPVFAHRLLSRSFRNLAVIQHNIESFAQALSEKKRDQRYGDQYGTLMACAFSLSSNKRITADQAREWCDQQDWSWTTQDNDVSDGERLLETILSARVSYDIKGSPRNSTIRAMIRREVYPDQAEGAESLAEALREYGIKATEESVIISNRCPALARVLNDTAWGGGWRRPLLSLDGAVETGTQRFTSEIRGRAVAIPMKLVMEGWLA